MDSNKQLTTKTDEENNRIRAAVLKDLNWDISPDSELFPLVKMYVLGAASNDAKMKQLTGMLSQLNMNLEEAKAVGGLTRSGWEIFLPRVRTLGVCDLLRDTGCRTCMRAYLRQQRGAACRRSGSGPLNLCTNAPAGD